MKKIIYILFLVLIALNLNAQNYDQLIKSADSCYSVKSYEKSTKYFKKAFKINPEAKKNFYNAACAASLANDKKNSFKWLTIAIDNGFDNLNHLKSDTDLDNLHNDKKWIEIIAELQKKTDIIEANYDKPLQKELIDIFKEDQEIRNQYVSAQKKYGYQSKETDSLGKIMAFKDSLNLIKITKILDEKGWVGKEKVGQQANQTLFLVIQHSDLKIQQKYLPMMREAVNKGNASSGSLALLEDRVALREGRKQIFGSQIATNPITKKPYILPLEDADNVDKRRQEVGLETLADYVKYWDIIWNVESYKKELLEIEKLNEKK
jgi:hypothetical protein